MKVSDVMTRTVEVVAPETTLREAAEKMKALDAGSLPVREDGELVGMVTDRDITVRAVAGGRDPNTTEVREVMTKNLVSCYTDDDLGAAARIMQREQVRRLVVLDRSGYLSGVVSLGDLAAGGASRKVTGQALKEISESRGGFAGRAVGLLALLALVGAILAAGSGGTDSGA